LSRQERIAAINCALEAGLSVMYVLTAKDLSGSLLSDNVIERVIELCRFQLQNTIYPEFDPVYRQTGMKGWVADHLKTLVFFVDFFSRYQDFEKLQFCAEICE